MGENLGDHPKSILMPDPVFCDGFEGTRPADSAGLLYACLECDKVSVYESSDLPTVVL